MDFNCIQHIGLCRLSAIGDVTLMVPVVRAIQKHYPQAQLSWIIGKAAYSLLEGLSGVNFIVLDKPKTLRDYWRCYWQLKPYQFDVLLAAQASLRTNLLYPLIKARVKIGFDAKRARDGHSLFINQRIAFAPEHLIEGFMRFAKMLGVTDYSPVANLPISPSDWEFAKRQLSRSSGPWLAVNPAASKSERNWLVERYAQVIDQAAHSFGVSVVVTGGSTAADKAMSDAVIATAKTSCLNLTGQTTLKQLAAVLGSVDALLSPDTGPLHIADAMQTPVIGLYAVAPSKLSGPYHSQSLVVDRFDQAVTQLLHQDPNHIAWGTRVHHSSAMQLISVEDVMQQLEKVFNAHDKNSKTSHDY